MHHTILAAAIAQHTDAPVIADDDETLVKSWQGLQEEKISTLYPAHGHPFTVSAIWESPLTTQQKGPTENDTSAIETWHLPDRLF